ncbi:DUF3800 domain-containing protein [Vreelandella alkaliphila]|uniref:DUF3800 domain-containing protein n=1 Tax=Vreelandella alkaliphila TaxID=272774 RepID=A0A7C9NPG8_9GAMM|nr:DUF3800 domain-containing protein [Halomonas alkaliphila]NDL70168.1 DUF3800 domain-containing protein [Halomonas alkaliphila]
MSQKKQNSESHHQLPLFEFDEDNLEKVRQHRPSAGEQESEFSKFVVYVDESGDHSLKSIDQTYPIFVLAFCVFHKRHYSEVIVPALQKFKFNHFGHDQVVLHENEIRRRKGLFNRFRNAGHQNAFLKELTQIIEFSNFVLISATIDKRALGKQNVEDNAYHIALGICMETLHQFLREKGEHTKKTHVVVECRGNQEDKELELEFRRICDGNNRLNQPLPFEILFADKKVMSSGLQLADLVARPIGLMTLRPDQPNRTFDTLKYKFYCEGGRDCTGAGYEGYGMQIFPYPKSEKPR